MLQRKFDHRFDERHSLPAASDVIVTDFVEALFFFLLLDRYPFAVLLRIRNDDAATGRVCFDHFEFYGQHATSHDEEIALVDRPAGLEEVPLEEDVEETPGQTSDCVINGQDVYALAGFDVRTTLNCTHVPQTDSKVVHDAAVHANLFIQARIIRNDDCGCLASLATLEIDGQRMKQCLKKKVEKGDSKSGLKIPGDSECRLRIREMD